LSAGADLPLDIFPVAGQTPGMEIGTQLALFLENQPGTLAAVCDELAAASINILALTISDTVDHSVVRMIVSDTRQALHIFEEHGTLVVENEVLLIEIDNQPGSLSRIAHRLAANRKKDCSFCGPATPVKRWPRCKQSNAALNGDFSTIPGAHGSDVMRSIETRRERVANLQSLPT
jgi:hypothetical protein